MQQQPGSASVPAQQQQQQMLQPTVPGTQPQQLNAPAFVPQSKKPRRKVLTSLTLEIFIYFGGWFDLVYYILNILVFVYKGELLDLSSKSAWSRITSHCTHAHCSSQLDAHAPSGLELLYPNNLFAMDFCFSWLWFLIEIPRLFLSEYIYKATTDL